jgi:ferrochelatase
LKSAALGRFETSTLDVATADAAAGALGKAPAVGFADAAPVGVLLVNLGAPDAPRAWAVRRYLRQFLSDRRVIEKDTFAWQLRLRSTILPVQSRRSARAYRSIWNHEANESPLKTITRSQADQLGKALAFGGGGDVTVDWVMRYGNPSIESRIKALIAEGCDRVVLVPLYPQYSSTTTATACDEAFRVLMRLRNQPSLRVAPPYYSDPVYVEAIASSISDHLAKLTFEPEVILASYHGLPQDYVEKGDPYLDQCKRTTELLRERLGLPEGKLVMTFQSRFGRAKWLRPYTDEILRRLAKSGIRNVAVVTPGFATDCVETLEEIAIENARGFKKRGGNNFALIPCLNDTERGMQVIREIALRELKGWV